MRAAAPLLLKGLGMTVLLCLVVVPAGVAGGLGVALLSTVRRAWGRWPLIVYVGFFRPFPPLVLLIFIFFGLPFLGLDLPAFAAVVIAFLLNTSSYYGEILRAGIESVGSGQTEAARSTGLGRGPTLPRASAAPPGRLLRPALAGRAAAEPARAPPARAPAMTPAGARTGVAFSRGLAPTDVVACVRLPGGAGHGA